MPSTVQGGSWNGPEKDMPPVAEAEPQMSGQKHFKVRALLVCRVLAALTSWEAGLWVPGSALLLRLGVREPFPNPPRPCLAFQSP